MKKSLVPLLLCCLLLSGCASGAQQRYLAFSQELAARDTLSFTAELTASYPQRNVAFTLRFDQQDGVRRVTVLSPASISGVSARVEQGGTALEYDGLILDTGDLDAYGLSPMSALPLMVEALCRGHADAFWEDEGLAYVELLYDDHTTVQVAFDEAMVPCRCEWICDGTVAVSCEIQNWS